MKFKCPKCNSSELEEVMTDVTVASEVLDIDEDGVMDYGDQTNEDAGVDRYQCGDCGEVLKDKQGSAISHPESLYEWLKERNMV